MCEPAVYAHLLWLKWCRAWFGIKTALCITMHSANSIYGFMDKADLWMLIHDRLPKNIIAVSVSHADSCSWLSYDFEEGEGSAGSVKHNIQPVLVPRCTGTSGSVAFTATCHLAPVLQIMCIACTCSRFWLKSSSKMIKQRVWKTNHQYRRRIVIITQAKKKKTHTWLNVCWFLPS